MYIPQYTIQSSTNFKTWITDLKQATMAVESFKNITATFKGTGLNTIIDDVTVIKYSNSIRGLTLEQAKLALSTTQLSTHEKELILTEAGLIAKTKELTASQAVETLQQELGDKANARSLLIQAGLITNKELEEDATIKVTFAKLEEAVANGLLTTEQSKLIASTFGVTGANYGEAVSFEVLTKAIWANIAAIAKWLITNPVGWAILATGAIAGTVAIINHFTVSLEESKEALSELKNECQTIESDLSSMNDELKTTVDRINELANKDTLTFTEKEEYDNLVKSNNELQRKIDLLELEQKLKNKEKNKTFVQTMTIDTENPFEHEVNPDGKKSKGQYGISDEYLTDETGYIKAQFEIRKQLLDDLAKAETEDEQKRIQERIDEIDSFLTEKNKEWNEVSDGVSYISEPSTEDEKAVNEWLDYIADFQDKMAIEMGGENAKTNAFNRLVDNWKFDETVQVLQTLGKQGRVTADMLNDPKYDEFINKLVELGVINSAENLAEIALAFNNFDTTVLNTSETVDTATYSIYTFKTATEDLKSTLDDTFDAQSTIQSAFDKIAEGTALSADEVRELIAIYPALADGFTKTVDGYTIDSQRLIDANADMVANTKKSYEERIQYLKDFINTPYDIKGIDSQAEANAYQLWTKNIEQAKTELSELEVVLLMFGITAKTVDNRYEELSKATSDFTSQSKTLNTALEEMSEHGQLSADTIQALTDAGYAQALVVNAETGAVTLNTKAYEELNLEKKKQIQLDIAKLELDLINPYKEETAAIADLKRSLSSLNTEERKATQIKISQMEASLANMKLSEEERKQKEQELARLKGLLSSLDAPTFEDSGSSSEDDEEPIAVTNFKKALAEKEHLLAMNKITEEEYYAWLETESKRVYSNLVDYEEELWKHEEDIYKWKLEKEQELFEKKIDNKERELENLDKSFELTGNVSVYDKQIDVYNQMIAQTQAEINRLLSKGYEKDSDEIQTLVEQIEGYSESIADIWEKQTDIISSNIEEQIDIIDRQIDNTGNTSLYTDKIKIYEDAQQKILDRIEFYRKQGYKEDSEIIKSLKQQWLEYQDSIDDTFETQVDKQIEIYNKLTEDKVSVLEEQQKTQDEMYDAELTALENKKKALEEETKELDKQKEIEEKKKSLIEAQRDVHKSLRMVYVGNGQYAAKPSQDSLDALEDVKAEIAEMQREQAQEAKVDAIDKEMERIKAEQELYDKSIEKQKEVLEDANNTFAETLNSAIDTELTPDYDVVAETGGKELAEQYKELYDEVNKDSVTPEITVNIDEKSIKDSNADTARDNPTEEYNPAIKLMDIVKYGKGSFDDIERLAKETFDKFGNVLNLKTTPTINVPAIGESTYVNNYTANNSPVFNTEIHVTANGGANEIAQTIADTVETKITQAFISYGSTYRKRLDQISNGR